MGSKIQRDGKISSSLFIDLLCLSLHFFDKLKSFFRWISEKMDGVRAYWNGVNLLSRHGKEINCPSWVSEGLPSGKKLDGELWMGRGTFERLNGILNSSSLDGDEMSTMWKKEIKYVVFDLVDSEMMYEERMEELRRMKLPSFASVVEVEECRGNDHLNELLQSIVRNNGEGIMLTKPHSQYVGERTRSRLKVKVKIISGITMNKAHEEMDVQVLAVVPNGLCCIQ